MPFNFVCPFCHARTRVEDRFAGQSGPCAECGKQVTLPSPASLGIAPAKQVEADIASTSNVSSDQQSHLNPSATWLSGSKKQMTKLALQVAVMASMLLIAFGVVGWLLIPSAQRAFEDRKRLGSISNIQQIAKALNAYRQDYGSYPTPTVSDPSGSPLYSWRVLLLPYLGYNGLYNRFQLEQPWDSPTNSQLLREMPPMFAIVGNNMALSLYESNYAYVVGPGTMFPNAFSDSVPEVTDDSSETILLVETKEGGLSWTQPGNLDNSAGVRIGTRPVTDIGGNFANFVLIATVDGNGMALSPQTPISTIQAMLSPDGGEYVVVETVDSSAPLP